VVRVQFQALPDSLRSSGSGTGSAQPREYRRDGAWKKIIATPVQRTKITAVRISRADYARPLYPRNLALTSPTSGGRSVGIVRSRAKGHEV
jgi:hypothetical protein